MLRKDIYNLQQPSSSITEIEVPDPDPLASIRYACAYWTNHAIAIEDHQGGNQGGSVFCDIGGMNDFLEKKVVYWLEAMSLMESIPRAVAMLMNLESAFERNKQGDDERSSLSSIAFDAKSFTLASRSIIEICPLQVYYSALIFSPTYGGNMLHMPRVLEGHGDSVRALAFSPDDGQLASASDDGTVRLWDPTVKPSPRGQRPNMGEVRRIMVSPDGNRLASLSEDRMILPSLYNPTMPSGLTGIWRYFQMSLVWRCCYFPKIETSLGLVTESGSGILLLGSRCTPW
ncbi:putative vegetative incompatibility protein HET-E-1 [Rosellinia necatrix]|uniref:Putative vegetative incompatibility protein HET-E-1 n=1 Tax=Rosellinia necatrix TaxID=77044 RepID=A0A1W2TSV3_ROSNE|nr:putative vegetative incompatibility protein HET-E-1 [Rosellinia necatrix]